MQPAPATACSLTDGRRLPPRPPALAQALAEWEAKEAERQAALAGVAGGMEEAGGAAGGDDGAPQFVAYVPLPDQKEIEARVLESKKAQLLSKYASEALQKEQETAKALRMGR